MNYMESLTIGQVAVEAGVGVETVRFYEREGLIAKPPRRVSGYRQYSYETVHRIIFIRRAKDLGFSLKEIAELLSLRVDPGCSCAEVKGRALNKIADVEMKIRSLKKIKKALEDLTIACRENDPISECPILSALEEWEGLDAHD